MFFDTKRDSRVDLVRGDADMLAAQECLDIGHHHPVWTKSDAAACQGRDHIGQAVGENELQMRLDILREDAARASRLSLVPSNEADRKVLRELTRDLDQQADELERLRAS